MGGRGWGFSLYNSECIILSVSQQQLEKSGSSPLHCSSGFTFIALVNSFTQSYEEFQWGQRLE